MSIVFHQELARKKIKFILDVFSHKYFTGKTILDAGAGNGDIGAALFRLGASVTAMDARQENLSIINKKYPTIKTSRVNFESGIQVNTKFDIGLSIGTICHLNNYEQHLKDLCARCKDLIIETAVCDSDDPNLAIQTSEDKKISALSFSGVGSRPSAQNIEAILASSGMNFVRLDLPALNHDNYKYDWAVSNTNNTDIGRRRLWVCSKYQRVVLEVGNKYKKIITENNNVSDSKQNFIPNFIPNHQPKQNVARLNKQININNQTIENKKFVIVIPSYKNQKWAEKNILSALNQNYDNFRILFTDDVSPDNTFTIVKQTIEKHKNANKAIAVRNTIRVGALENLYNMIHSCEDDEIIITLDGDDWLADNEVLNKLNKEYHGDVWMTYGQYKCHPNGGGHCKQIPDFVIKSNNFRQHAWLSSHLRTFYAWLFKKIKKEDLMYDGKFAQSAWDMWIMYPLLEMSGTRSKFISDILYIYNLENPINDHKVDRSLQSNLDKVSRGMQKYSKLESAPEPKKISVGLLLIATAKYNIFIQQLINSADTNFFNDKRFDVKYFIFTDSDTIPKTNRQYQIINIQHKPFPYASMDRFKHFANNKNYLSEMDYLYYVDVDCKFVSDVGSEILGNLVGVRHCGYFNGGGTFENNPKSAFYAEHNKYKYYFGGGFSGGKSEKYLKLSDWCSVMIDKDLENNIMPLWHDETALNKYYLDNEPDVILSPSYHYPENDINYVSKWHPHKFQPKILLLDKNHKEIRS